MLQQSPTNREMRIEVHDQSLRENVNLLEPQLCTISSLPQAISVPPSSLQVQQDTVSNANVFAVGHQASTNRTPEVQFDHFDPGSDPGSESDSDTIEDPNLYQGMYASPLAEPEASKVAVAATEADYSVLDCKGDSGGSKLDGKTEQASHDLPSPYNLLPAVERISALVDEQGRKIDQQDAKIESLEQQIQKVEEICSLKGKRDGDKVTLVEDTAPKKRRVHFDR